VVVMESTIFWDITPCTPLKVNRRFGGTYRLPPAFTLVSCSAYSTLKMEAICSSETSVDLQRTTGVISLQCLYCLLLLSVEVKKGGGAFLDKAFC
jgi:hypothetical protein